MPSNCTAYKCRNKSDAGYTLVRYPHDETLKQKWIAAVGRGKNWSPSSSQKLCEVHFQPSEIEFVAGRKRIKLGSVPSRFCTCPKDQNKCRRKLGQKQKYRNGPYQRQTSVGKHSNDCCIVQPPVKKDGILSDKQEELMEEIRRENDMLRTVVSLLQKILQNRKQ